MTLSLFRKIHMKAAFACCAFLIALPFSASHAGNIVHSGLPGAPVIVGTENRKPPETVSENNVPEAARSPVDQNDAKTQFHLGLMSKNGYGVPVDPVKAREWFAKAAGQNYQPAQYQLALMQFSGTGGTENKSAAIEQFKKLASEGYAPAQYTLGYLNRKAMASRKIPEKPASGSKRPPQKKMCAQPLHWHGFI